MSCTHPDVLAAELKGLAAALLDRLDPLVAGVGPAGSGAGPGADPGTPSSCASCPVCAVLALLRGERPELAVRLAAQASGILAALRALLDELPDTPGAGPGAGGRPDEGAGDRNGPGRSTRAGRRVQRIPVVRV